jgi:hypothetical protein
VACCTLFWFTGSPLPCIALGLGISALSEIRRNGLAGHWQAITGIVRGVIAIVAGTGILIANVAMMS